MKKLIFLCLLAAGCAANPHQQELQAFTKLVQEEVLAGRITQAQADYLILRRKNELQAMQDADFVNTLSIMRMGR